MGTAENKDIVLRIFNGGPAELPAHLADDVRWTVHGNAKFCDTYKGKDDVLQRLFGGLIPLMETMGQMEVGNVIAGDDHVVVQAVATGRMTKTGRPYNNDYCLVLKLVDGKVTELDEYCDTELVTTAFGPK